MVSLAGTPSQGAGAMVVAERSVVSRHVNRAAGKKGGMDV